MSDLKYDMQQLTNIRNDINSAADTIDNAKKSLTTQLSNLKTQWNTPAGREFFSNYEDNWSSSVDSYVQLIHNIVDVLDQGYTFYDDIDNDIATKLHID